MILWGFNLTCEKCGFQAEMSHEETIGGQATADRRTQAIADVYRAWDQHLRGCNGVARQDMWRHYINATEPLELTTS